VTTSDQLREEARLARENLVTTVGELGDTVQLAKAETVTTAKKYAPIAAGVLGALILVKVVRR
jgi:putative Ca2+/H+ antiporter (TMEM165/GDT1 family)